MCDKAIWLFILRSLHHLLCVIYTVRQQNNSLNIQLCSVFRVLDTIYLAADVQMEGGSTSETRILKVLILIVLTVANWVQVLLEAKLA